MEGDLRPPALSAVQGVFFRDSTVQEANRLRLRGFVKNTPQGTVQGEVQGPADKAEQMKKWLGSTGSPASHIDKADFTEEGSLDTYTYESFEG